MLSDPVEAPLDAPAEAGLGGLSARGGQLVNVGLPTVRGPVDRLVVMGVLNVTPDSFSDGGLWAEADTAIGQGLQLWADGADIVDVGGESTRPGAAEIGPDEEAARVVPVVSGLVAAGVVVSVDTYRSAVATAALEAGATMVNDVSGGLADPNMVRVVRDARCPWVLMHWRGPSSHMNHLAVYQDVVTEVVGELRARWDVALAAGIDASALVIDPGLGFAKHAEHNWAVLCAIEEVIGIGPPVLVGASRKSFLGALLADEHGLRPVQLRESATTAITAYVAGAGGWGVRVHDPRAAVDAALTMAAIRAGAANLAGASRAGSPGSAVPGSSAVPGGPAGGDPGSPAAVGAPL